MLSSFKARAELQRKAGNIYGAIVTQARQPDFYLNFAIPDTPAGRYEVVVLHLFLVLERLGNGQPQFEDLPRLLVETFVTDMDDALREMGTGDVSVGKHVRRAVAGLYERSRDYKAALAAGDPGELRRSLARHLLGRDGVDGHSLGLADYVGRAAVCLAAQDEASMLEGRCVFPVVPTVAEDVR